MSLIRCDNLSIAFGDTPLLDNAQFNVESGERVCLIGRNGAGKSTLLKALSGDITVDQGNVQRRNGLRISDLAQQLPVATYPHRNAVTATLRCRCSIKISSSGA